VVRTGAGEAAAEVQVGQGLGEAVVGHAEAGGAVRTQRGVERFAQPVGELVGTMVEAGVVVPGAEAAAHAGHQADVEVLADRNRAVAVWIHLRPVGLAFRVTVVVGALGIALVPGAEAVQRGVAGQRQFGVEPAVQLPGVAVAEVVVAAALHGEVGRGLVPGRNLVEAGAVGGIALLVAGAQAQEAAVAQGDAGLAMGMASLAVAQAAPDRLQPGVVQAIAGLQGAAFGAAGEDDVDHSGHRVRSVLGAGAIAQHLDPRHRADRDGVEIDRRGAAADLGVGGHHGAGVAAAPVDQDQHLVRREPAQLRRAHVVGAAGVGLAREVERGQQCLQRAAQFAGRARGAAQVLGGEHVHRRGGLQHGAVAGAGAGDDDLVQGGGGDGRLRGGGRGQGEGQDEGEAGAGMGGHAAACSGILISIRMER